MTFQTFCHEKYKGGRAQTWSTKLRYAKQANVPVWTDTVTSSLYFPSEREQNSLFFRSVLTNQEQFIIEKICISKTSYKMLTV